MTESRPALPPDDPLRRVLHEEVHARPPALLEAPERIAHLALRVAPESQPAEDAALAALATTVGLPMPEPRKAYAWLDCGAFRVKWERHTEFSGWTFYRRVTADTPSEASALDVVPADWLATLPGPTLVAMEILLNRAPVESAAAAIARFGDTMVVGSRLGEGAATVLSDLRIDAGGFIHFLLLDHGMSPRQAGRYAQRLIEIETYRMMSLLAFPLAKDVAPALTEAEARLARIAERTAAEQGDHEAALLDDLTRLAAEIERSESRSRFRFGAAAAYYRLVGQRIGELREARIPGVQTLQEFMDRRLAPAMATCASIASRQSELSARIARASQLLRTRVDVALERQNQALLASMDRRARLQLRLQQTVEGLSIAAITYYVVGLVGYLAKGLKSVQVPIDPEIAIAVSIPLVASAAWLALRRARRHFERN
ncbi:MAG: DUF3422 domain-containing protein [Burkholderiales bacterium]